MEKLRIVVLKVALVVLAASGIVCGPGAPTPPPATAFLTFVSMEPNAGATDVDPDVTIGVTFDRPVLRSTCTSDYVRLLVPGADPVSGCALTVPADHPRQVWIDPPGSLEEGVTHEVRLAFGLLGAGGEPLGQQYGKLFTIREREPRPDRAWLEAVAFEVDVREGVPGEPTEPMDGASGRYPSIAMDAAGNAMVVWLEQVLAHDRPVMLWQIWTRRFDILSGWEPPHRIFVNAGDSGVPHIAGNAAGQMLLCGPYQDLDAVDPDYAHGIWVRYYDPGLGWVSPAGLREYLDYPVAVEGVRGAIDDAGNMEVAYRFRDVDPAAPIPSYWGVCVRKYDATNGFQGSYTPARGAYDFGKSDFVMNSAGEGFLAFVHGNDGLMHGHRLTRVPARSWSNGGKSTPSAATASKPALAVVS